MQRTISLNSHEYEMILNALMVHRSRYLLEPCDLSADDVKMRVEQIELLIKRMSNQSNAPIGGVFIDGERM